jgi:two-component system sensor histidine kinase/response regulator
VVDVRDSGIGIAAANIPLLFEPFAQFARKREGRALGTGLGLPIVRRLVELHGGSVEVVSVLGSGSTFTARFPQPPRLAEVSG